MMTEEIPQIKEKLIEGEESQLIDALEKPTFADLFHKAHNKQLSL